SWYSIIWFNLKECVVICLSDASDSYIYANYSCDFASNKKGTIITPFLFKNRILVNFTKMFY
ncbi:MAG: hypothetical protein QOK54_10595, partial [Nitrososphaeraceae archaeon]|nr:hypothetical protein [Nitrososphaeraceae archaeon]